jgi:pimeloyl-ACP methyl ester carboxylesterase
MPSGAYSVADYVADIEALILAGYQGRTFVLVGHFDGRSIATRLAVKRPDLVRAVVSIDGALGFDAAAARLFSKTAQELAVDDPAMVVSLGCFAGVYDPGTDPAFKRWHARRVQGMPKHVVRESFGPLFTGPD